MSDVKITINRSHLLVAALVVLAFIAGGFLSGSFTTPAIDNSGPGSKISFDQAIGTKAPDFSLPSINGKTVKLSDYAGKNVVLFFNEGEMCYPACWQQIAAFGNDARFNSDDTIAFSIVVDTKSQWDRIRAQVSQLANANILFDKNGLVSEAYDVLSLPSSMHPGAYPGHTYIIIDKAGTIRYTLDDPQMAMRNDQIFKEINQGA